MRRIISLLLENESGALSRIVGLFSQRGYNIESLTVSPTHEPSLSRITLVTRGDSRVLEQIIKQLHKLIDVLKVSDLTDGSHIEQELALIKIASVGNKRDEVKRLVEIFNGRIIDVTSRLYTVRLVGEGAKLDAFIEQVREAAEIVEVARSGIVGMARGERALRP